jgi:tetratricopeptide (TPR) repeat protein
MLRDDESADLSLRLKALAPDELRADTVLAELRRRESLPMDLAAAVHELLEARRRLEAGAEPTEADRARAVRVADLLGRQIGRPHRPAAPTAAAASVPPPLPAELAPPATHVQRPVGLWAAGVALLVMLIAIGSVLWFRRGETNGEMREALALFEAGQYADAAAHFWRYAEANPGEVTPHLYLARIHRRMNRPELAADALRQAQSIAPDDPAVHRELGFLLLDTGRADVAVDRFRRAIELDEASSEGWVGLVRALREADRAAEAEQAILQAPAEIRALLARPDSI